MPMYHQPTTEELLEIPGTFADGVTDDSAALQAWIDAGVGKITAPPGRTYLIETGLSHDVAVVGIDWNNSIITVDAAVAIGYTLTSTESSNTTRPDQTLRGPKNLILRGGSAGTAIAFVTGATFGPSDAALENITVSEFAVGIDIGNNTYLNSFKSMKFRGCTTCVYMPSRTNSGERMTFIDCTFAESDEALDIADGDGNFYFNTCSFDYNLTTIGTIAGTLTQFNTCHFETDHLDLPWLTVTGGLGHVVFNGGRFLPIGTVPHALTHYFDVASTSSITFNDVNMYNMRNDDELLCTGAGEIYLRGTTAHDSTSLPYRTHDDLSSNYVYGTFENANLAANFSVRDASWADAANRLTSANATISSSTDDPRTGTRSLKLVKASADNTQGDISCLIDTFRPGDGFSFEVWHKISAGTSEGWNLRFYWVSYYLSVNAQPQYLVTSEFATVAASSTTTYQRAGLRYITGRNMPAWANGVRILFDMSTTPAATFYFDDMYVNKC